MHKRKGQQEYSVNLTVYKLPDPLRNIELKIA